MDNILASLAIKSLEIVNKLGINFFLNTIPMVEEILKKYVGKKNKYFG